MAHPVPPQRALRTFGGLRRLIALLRGPDGCPWDRVQTRESLRPFLLEETAEAIDALDEGDADKLREELGDVLFEVLLQVQLAEEVGEFRMSDVIQDVASKLIRRHPHVFADASADTPEAVIDQWDELKKKERGPQSALAGVPVALPALAYAQAIQRRAGKTGFQWESDAQAWDAVHEEFGDLRAAAATEERIAEAGDAIFALANLLRYMQVDAEDALRQTCRRFSSTFSIMEASVAERGLSLSEVDFDTKVSLWEEAKTHHRRRP